MDACRIDLLCEVADDYPFIDNVNSVTSVGSTSAEWLQKTFDYEHQSQIEETVYITGNPHSATVLDEERFEELDEMWRYAWDEKIGTIRPRPITDHLIDVCRNRNPDRVIGHYMQPHYPFLSDLDIRPSDMQGDVWIALREGDYSQKRVWKAYRENLRIVLNDIELLLENVNADRVVLTADHGNAVGEYGFYGHPPGFPLKEIREVPWIVTSAVDEERYNPEDHYSQDDVQEGW